ncbi:unnamed protein product [Cuscuta epithymum]|uniref:Germin-like protein n=2 Tax=Cuscuta epithymum TaxID=186058 RepID=A0AAV0CIB5_9ASTE|nr:unnamed protein product [Cuscuta epithymum]
MGLSLVTLVVFITFSFSFAYASDPSPVQDFCVADRKATVFMNGMACKDPKLATVDDFFTSGLNTASRPRAGLPGWNYSAASVEEIPGLNTLGLAMIRNEFAVNFAIPPHFHLRATEMSLVLQGRVFFGFVTVDPIDSAKSRVFARNYSAGDVFVIPQSLVHFGKNIGQGKATTISMFSSQNPGLKIIPAQLFGKDSTIPVDVLSQSFRVSHEVIQQIRSHF